MKNKTKRINQLIKIEWCNDRREELRKWAIKVAGGCELQVGEGDKKYYPFRAKQSCKFLKRVFTCETCFNSGLGRLMKENNPAYKEHNKPTDRINEI